MGFMDKLKAMKNAVTGGAADVSLEIIDPSLEEPFVIKIKARTRDAEVKIDKVYLNVRGVEYVEVPDVDVYYDEDDGHSSRLEIVSHETITLEIEIDVSGPQVLEAETEFEWECQVALPEDSLPCYDGRKAKHYYQALGAIDCFGNDPDSGWIEFYVD